MPYRPSLALLLATTLSALPDGEPLAAWPHDSSNGNVPISIGVGEQRYPSILSDGAGGAFIAWHDSRNGGSNYDIYAQRIDANGVPMWSTNGVPVCSAPADQANTSLVWDGAGGVIVAWHDLRAGTWDIYAQRLNSAGVVQWTANGVAMSAAVQNQINPVAVTDGTGGAIVTWSDSRNGNDDIFAQRINAAGVTQWTANGVALCTAAGAQFVPSVVADGAGGAVVVWQDDRGSSSDVWGQRVNAAGVVQWAVNGVPIIALSTREEENPKAVPDDGGGAIIVSDFAYTDADILIQRVNGAGSTLWTGPSSGGLLLSTTGQLDRSPVIAADGQGGAVVAWRSSVAQQSCAPNCPPDDIHAQRVNAAGQVLWAGGGVVVSAVLNHQTDPVIIPDGSGVGGAIVTWIDNRSGVAWDIYSQALNPNGEPKWTTGGVALCTASSNQTNPQIVADGANGGIVAWIDSRNGTNDVYAQRVDRYGEIGEPEPTVVAVSDVPNDQGGHVQVEWTASYLDAYPGFAISGYSIWRRVPNPVAPTALDGDSRFRRMASVHGAQAVYWEYLATLPARGRPGYSYVAPTTSDQLPGSNPYTSFMVSAEKAGGIPFWDSAPDSGYSIDNLAPPTPAPFTGTYASGSTALHWGISSATDFAEYRLYRGTSPGFVPGAGNIVASLPDTGYVDAAGAPFYYKLSAVDIHGNESPFALLTPSGTVSTEGAGLPSEPRLAILGPNPAVASTRVAFGLPRAGTVSLVVHDVTGRTVRVLFRGTHPAGHFDLPWDLCDDAGAPVPNGVHFVRLETGGQSRSHRIVTMR